MKDGTKNGFTILEMIIALAVLAITLLASLNTIINVGRNGALVRKTSTACQLCQTKIEALKSLGYEAIADSQELNINEHGSPGGQFDRTVIVRDGAVNDTRVVVVTVSWNTSFKTQAVSLKTLIAK